MGEYDNKVIPPPVLSQVQSDERPCPVCPDESGHETMCEPEVDGSHKYYECEECGYAFGYEKIEEGVRLEGNCSIGVPESVRRAASQPMESAMAKEQAAQPVTITIGRRPDE